MCCGILEQRKAPGQECAEALDCPGNAAYFFLGLGGGTCDTDSF